MRKFYIENEVNERFSLWGNRVYFVDPTGLGIKHDATYIRIGDSFIRNKDLQVAQSNIGGKIEFLDPGANEKFIEFYNFCAAASELKLVYDPGNGKEYIRDIDIALADKTERTGATLPISIKFTCKTLYYLKNNSNFVFDSDAAEKRYDYQYDFTYNDLGTYETMIENEGHVAAPFDCYIYGYTANPSIHILKDNETVHEVTFPVAVEEGDYIRYSSRDGKLEASLVSGDKVTNLFNLLDIEKDNFFKIPKGKSKIVFSSSSLSTNIITLTIYKMYEVV